jgi:hypothetical protein
MATNGTLCVVDKRSLEHLASRFRDSETRTKILREELASSIWQADADKVPQKDICEATGYTRQQIRRIVIAEAERMAAEAGDPTPAPSDPGSGG